MDRSRLSLATTSISWWGQALNTEQLSYGGVSNLTQFQVLRRVQNDTGIHVSVERSELKEETLGRAVTTATCVKLVFSVKEYRKTRQGRVLVREGLRAVALAKVVETWSLIADHGAMTEVETPVEEIYRGRIETPDEAIERVAYEEMCHRPGTSRYPMMNSARIAQFKQGGL